MHLHRLLVASTFLAACGSPPPPAAPAPATTPVTAIARSADEVGSPDTRWADAGAPYTAVFDGLIHVRGIAELPQPSFPGRDFQIGVFDDAASWQRFTAAAELDPFGAIDWDRQVVVYTVLDRQTNMLGLDEMSAEGDTAALKILWVQIEPHYVNASPAVLVLVDRDAARAVRISAGELPLGTVAL